MDIESTPPINVVTPRSELKLYHYVGDFFNILKAFIGTNYQALPFAFKNSGLLFGILGVFGIAAMTDHCCQLMVRCKYYVIEIIIAEERQAGKLTEVEMCELEIKLGRTLSYGDIGKKVFGTWCYHLIQIAVWFTQFTTGIAYFIFIGNTVYEFFPIVQVPFNTSIQNNSRPIHVLDYNAGYGVPMLDIHYIGLNEHDYRLVNHSHLDKTIYNKALIIQKDVSHNILVPNRFDQNHATNISVQADNSGLMKISEEATGRPITVTFPAPVEKTTTANSNVTNHTISTTIQTTTTMLPTLPPKPERRWTPSAPDLKLVVLFPLPFFICTSIIKNLRLIAPFSTIATLFLGIGAMSVFVYLVHGFTLFAGGFHYVQFATLPLFIGQLISAYEGIGCIIPIESSMVGNRWIFPKFLRAAVFTVFVILCSFGIVGYLRYGDTVEQIIVLNSKQHTPLSMFIDITLILSVLFTYPLQCFPAIDITEIYIFSFVHWLKSPQTLQDRLEYDEINSESPDNGNIQHDGSSSSDQKGLMESVSSVSSVDASLSNAAIHEVMIGVPDWQRNIIRVLLTLSIVAFAILCRNSYAYLAAFTGAVGCSLLAYIIPCAVHLKVKWGNLSDENKVKDILIIGFSIVVSILTLVAIVQQIVAKAPI